MSFSFEEIYRRLLRRMAVGKSISRAVNFFAVHKRAHSGGEFVANQLHFGPQMILKSWKRFALPTAILFISIVGATTLIVRSQMTIKVSSKSAVEGKVILLAESEKQTFKSGEPITVKLSLRNDTNQEIYIIRTDPRKDNEVEIRNVRGEKIPMSEKGRKLLDSPVMLRIVSKIGAGQSFEYTVSLGDLYDLPPEGVYSAVVKRKFLKRDVKTFAEVQSNPVTVTVRR